MKTFATSALAATAVLVLAGCGSGNGYGSGSGESKSGGDSSSSPKGGSGGIHLASTKLGKVLVDGSGMTVYLLTSDKPNTSTCDASCLNYWHPVAPGSTSIAGVQAPVSQTKTPSGDAIATVGGWPLYTYVQDHAPGDVTGQDVKSFGGTWYVVGADGKAVEDASTGSSDSGSSSGYSY